MNRIRLLPDHVANQIAAGEVIERPASIVKELVENALDADAKKVTVEIQAGGRSLVRITDDGFGMSRDDALLALERHATSKIQRAEDLASIATMGFRGEALPSIASVSRFTLTTRERDSTSPEGTQIIVSGGKIAEVKAAGSATGTSIEVRQVFFNLPARRKFLRSEETEAAHVQHYLTLAALAYPEVAFTFLKDTRTIWQLPAQKSSGDVAAQLPALRERLRALMGDVKLLSVDFTAQLAGETETASDETESFETAVPASGEVPSPVTRHPSLRVWGFIGSPGVARSTREDQHIFVNRRPVENRGINFALLEGYHNSLMKGRYPVCCLFLEINPAAVDVNIHPAKREVKFHREFEIRKHVAEAVRQALLAFHGEGRSTEPLLPSTPAGSSGASPHPSKSTPNPAPTESPQDRWGERPREPLPEQASLAMGFAPAPQSAPSAKSAGDTPSYSEFRTPHSALASTVPVESTIGNRQSAIPVPLLNVPLRIVGVVGTLYVVLESDRGLVLLDQHAAHERILFEQMRDRLEQGGSAPSQKLLLPETIEVSVRDAHFLRGQLAGLTRLGVGLSEFGERTFLLDALPPFVKAPDARKFVLELVDELKAAGAEVNSSRLGEAVVAKTVCRHAVKANDPLKGPELEKLVDDLRRCTMPYTCPHGRPTLIEMNYRELEKKFGRTQ